MTSPWGTGPWGTGAFGASPSALASAYATSTNDVTVNLTGPALTRHVVVTGDALNPNTWQIVRGDTNAIVPIASITQINPTQYVLHTQVALPPQYVLCTLFATTLLSATGGPISSPTSMQFYGVTEEATSTPAKQATSQTQTATDLLNRQSPSVDGSYGLSGTLVARGGDYANERGQSLQKKLIWRRLVAKPGDFYHLPDYGCGLSLKEPLPSSELTPLQSRIKQQVGLEQDVTNVSVSLVQDPTNGVLNVGLSYTDSATGQTVSPAMPFKIGGAR